MKKNKDFELFQKYFKEYQKRFGLTGWAVYFKYEPIGTDFATIVTENNMTAAIRLNNDVPEELKPHSNLKREAKHEAIHLLLGRYVNKAETRYINKEELWEAEEELVNKLAGLIPD